MSQTLKTTWRKALMRSDLIASVKMTGVAACEFADSKTGARIYPGVGLLAESVGLSRRSVIEHTQILVDAGWLKQLYQGKGAKLVGGKRLANEYQLSFPEEGFQYSGKGTNTFARRGQARRKRENLTSAELALDTSAELHASDAENSRQNESTSAELAPLLVQNYTTTSAELHDSLVKPGLHNIPSYSSPHNPSPHIHPAVASATGPSANSREGRESADRMQISSKPTASAWPQPPSQALALRAEPRKQAGAKLTIGDFDDVRKQLEEEAVIIPGSVQDEQKLREMLIKGWTFEGIHQAFQARIAS
jgi:hypothetical protein